jgi:FtsP/CotA-like multicopper oxidase with cupredoxin domain
MPTLRTRFAAIIALPAICLTVQWAAPGAAAQEGNAEIPRACSDVSAPAGSAADFPQPAVRTSSRGVLKTSLHACIAKNTIFDPPSKETRVIHTPTFEGTIPGPTLVVRPGDKLAIDLVNDLPDNPTDQRKGAFPHDPHTLNLHTHGLIVSPLGIADNPFRPMEPGTTNKIEVDIPKDHPTGTFWYHPHKHGAVTFDLIGGMAGFLIVKGGPGTLDAVPEVAAARDVVMGFQIIRTTVDGDTVFVNEKSQQFGTWPPDTEEKKQQGPWSKYGIDGAPGRSFFYVTTNGVTNPKLHMRPGEVQRWRLLNASSDNNLLVALQGHGLNIIAMDGITVANMYRLKQGEPVVLGPGQRADVLVKGGAIGAYILQALDPGAPGNQASVSPSGIDPAPRASRHSEDFPRPCGSEIGGPLPDGFSDEPCPPDRVHYPVALATIDVDGSPTDMKLPAGPLPVPEGLPSVRKMLAKIPDAVRHVAFENCGNIKTVSMHIPGYRLPSCGWYYAKYDAAYWGGTPFNSLLMLRDDDDKGKPNDDKKMPLIDFKKDGLFNSKQALFPDMVAGNYEEWTVINRSFTDHPFHIHQNHFLLTKINNKPLATPEWHDTILVPGAEPQPNGPCPPPRRSCLIPPPLPPPVPNINDVSYGSITFRIFFNPRTVGCFVMHCHALTHEDLGMMQRLDILPAKNQPSGCVLEATMDH